MFSLWVDFSYDLTFQGPTWTKFLILLKKHGSERHFYSFYLILYIEFYFHSLYF